MHETARELKGELDSKLSALQALVLIARQESQRLEAAIKTAEAMEISPPATDSPASRAWRSLQRGQRRVAGAGGGRNAAAT